MTFCKRGEDYAEVYYASIEAATLKHPHKRTGTILIFAVMLFFFFLTFVSAAFVPTFSKDNIVETFCNDISQPMLLNTSAVYLCKENLHMLFHVSKLNTLNLSHTELAGFAIPRRKNVWVEVNANEYTTVSDGGIPYTGCLSLENGDDGALSGTISDTFGVTASLSLLYALATIVVATININLAGSVGGSYSVSAEYKCLAKAGETVQLTIVPSYYRFREAQFRYLIPNKKRIAYGNWEYIPDTQVLSSAPMFKCVTDPELLQCDVDSLFPAQKK